MDFLRNRFVQLILVLLVIFALLVILKMNFHAQVGPTGVSAGVERTP